MTIAAEPIFRSSPRLAAGTGKLGRRPRLRKRLAATLAFAGIAGYLLGGFWRFTEEVDRLSTPVASADADAIVVLTGGAMRIDYGLDLLRSGKGRRLLISGVHPGTSVATLARLTNTDKRLFDCCVDIDYLAADTIGNAEIAGRWAEKRGYRDLILVTSDYHMPRSLLEFDRVSSIRSVTPVAVRRDDLWSGERLLTGSGLRLLLTEYGKYVATRIRGGLGMAPQENEDDASHMASLD
ncbi:YdcF family protein [Jiella sonneratiae]|uniref:YdcF family protein n=1 Tax=Jiella sonneratiae TaxID=2816856 RepID=A0ABS3IYH4_9HYPH|nr:YdcF family protein [Jiella sonneratiae]MBO0902466.1 YdcF family protein [Jiella sonneratiae]